MTPPYDHDLALIHNQGYDGFIRSAAPGLLKLLKQQGIEDGMLVDMGCGGGIWANELVKAGYEVVGVDISSAMIELSRQRVPQAKFYVDSFLNFAMPPCRAITALGEVVCYLFDAKNSLRALQRFCKHAFQTLEHGGLLIFDVAEPARSKVIKQHVRTGQDWACLVQIEKDEKKQQLTRKITSFLQAGEHYRRREETHVLQLYRRSDVSKMLRGIGFRVRMVRAYGEMPFPPALTGFIARKP